MQPLVPPRVLDQTEPELPEGFRKLDDVDAQRQATFDKVRNAYANKKVSQQGYTLQFADVDYHKPKAYSIANEKDAILGKRRMNWNLHGRMQLLDPEGQVVSEDAKPRLLAQVPYLTRRGTYIYGGNEYVVSNQQRLRPGIYTRRQNNGNVESQFNIIPGTGRGFRLNVDPASGIFRMQVGQGQMKLYPILKDLGVTDKQMIEAWGKDLYEKNVVHDDKNDRQSITKLAARLGGPQDAKLAPDAALKRIGEMFERMRLDPEVTQATMGKAYDKVDTNTLLAATSRILNVSRKEADEDDRDAQQFQSFHAPEDFFGEHVDKDSGQLLRQAIYKARRRGDVSAIPNGYFSKQLQSVLLGSGLASPAAEINPIEILDQRHKINRMGEGGIGCFTADTEVLTESGWVAWPDVNEDTEFACRAGDRMFYAQADRLHVGEFDGDIHVSQTSQIDLAVTPGHRLYISYKGNSGWSEHVFRTAAEQDLKPARHLSGGCHIKKSGSIVEYELSAAPTKGANPGLQRTGSHCFSFADWCDFIGVYLAEGSYCYNTDRREYRVDIGKCRDRNPNEWAYIDSLLSRMGLTYRYEQGRRFIISGKDLAFHVSKLGHSREKHIPEYILSADPYYRYRTFRSLTMMDRFLSGTSINYSSASGRLADQVGRIGLENGYTVKYIDRSKPGNPRYYAKLRSVRTVSAIRQRGGEQVRWERYSGTVYCATVPGGLLCTRRNGKVVWSGNSTDAVPRDARGVQPTHYGFIDYLRAPESLKIGLDLRAASGTVKGADGKLYMKVRNNRTGKLEYAHAGQLNGKVLGFPGELDSDEALTYGPGNAVRALVNGRISYVDPKKIDYEVPDASQVFTPTTNIVPLSSMAKGQRLIMGARMSSQALPVEGAEAPLVRPRSPFGSNSVHNELSGAMGAVRSDQAGVVKKVTPDGITVQYQDGTTKIHETYNNFMFNQMTGINNTALVQKGDTVEPGQVLAKSNYTDDRGNLAMGRNLRVGYHMMDGLTHEDAVVISESAAKKLRSEKYYRSTLETGESIDNISGKQFIAKYPGKFNKEQLSKLDENGVVTPGTVLRKGDPMILAVGKQRKKIRGSLVGGKKSQFKDVSETWDAEHEGVVTDVYKTPKGWRVVAKSYADAQVASKLCYDPETEVLTRDRGWVNVSEVREGEQLYSLVPGTETIEFATAVKVHRYQHSGPMYDYTSKYVDLLVTDNHRLYAAPRGKDYNLYEAKTLFGKVFRFKQDGEWEGRSPRSVSLGRYELSSKDYCALLGIYLSEGSLLDQPKCGSYGIDIAQHKEPNLSELIEWLDGRGIRHSKNPGSGRRVYGKDLLNHFTEFGKAADKHIPPHIFQWAKEDLLELFDWLMWGDGNRTSTTWNYCTTSRQLADDVQRLCLLIGMAASIKVSPAHTFEQNGKMYNASIKYSIRVRRFRVRPQTNPYRESSHRSEKWTDYEGEVFCPELDRNHILYVRRNGHPVWCGNSNMYGGKGVISRIVPDDQMPHAADGTPLEVALNPMGVSSRVNPSQLAESALAKVAAKTGKPYTIDTFTKENLTELAMAELEKHGMSDTEDLVDPRTGRTIPSVFTGVQHFYKLYHEPDKKLNYRDTAAYTMDDQPAKGGKTGCFVARQRILTDSGWRSIGEVAEKKKQCMVRTWSTESGEWVYRPVVDWFVHRSKVSDVLTVEFKGPTFGERKGWSVQTMDVTVNHEVFLSDGSKKLAGDLNRDDRLATWGVLPTEDQWELAVGTMLGDASCKTAGKFNSEHSVKQLNYVDWKLELFGSLGATFYDQDRDPSESSLCKNRIRSRVVSVNNPEVVDRLTELCYTGDGGRKRVTPEWAAQLTEKSIVMWFLGDGSISSKGVTAKGKIKLSGDFAAYAFSYAEKQLLVGRLSELFGAHFRIKEGCGKISLRKAGCLAIMRAIARYVPYQNIPASKSVVRRFAESAQEVEPVQPLSLRGKMGLYPARIRDIRPYRHDKPGVTEINVYDITVDDTHSYCAGAALVSNSKRIGQLEIAGLIAHGTPSLLRDTKLTRGQRNDDYWQSYRLGQRPPEPRFSAQYEKFENLLRGAGVNLKKTGPKTQLLPMSDADVEEMAQGREITSGDTVDFDTGEPVEGGLFDVAKTGGGDGKKWSYISLPEPMPNPIWENPLKSIFGLTGPKFEAILAGEEEFHGATGGKAFQKALQSLDIEKEIDAQISILKEGRKTKRDKAAKKIGYLQALKRNGINPTDLMMTKVPVLPPKFRPVSRMEGIELVSDANHLYKELLEANSNYKDAARVFGSPGSNRKTVYDAFKAVTGLGGPVTPESQEREVKGLLKQVFGARGPKFGFYQRNVIGTPVDFTGRAVITPDPDYDMDEVGLPVDAAWQSFRPFVMKELIKNGMKGRDAMRAVKERTNTATDALNKVMAERPIVINRAPTLHKHSLTSHYAKPVAGHALRVPIPILGGLGGDFDGDALNYHVPVGDDAVRDAREKLLPSKSLFSARDFDIHMKPDQGFVMGLYLGSTEEKKDGEVFKFKNKDEAIRAYKAGKIDANDRIEIQDA